MLQKVVLHNFEGELIIQKNDEILVIEKESNKRWPISGDRIGFVEVFEKININTNVDSSKREEK